MAASARNRAQALNREVSKRLGSPISSGRCGACGKDRKALYGVGADADAWCYPCVKDGVRRGLIE